MKIIIHPKYQSARSFISEIPKRFETEGEMIHDGRNTVKRFKTNENEWVVKRYKNPNIFQRIAYSFFKKSKAERAYMYADRLRKADIDTPEGIAYIEDKKLGLLHFSYFISPACYDPCIFPALVDTKDYDHRLADALTAFFVKLHAKGVLHGDLNLNNILYHQDKKGEFHFSVIDTNRSLFKASLSRLECLDNLKRVTHRRDLLEYIVERYASLRRWDLYESVETVMEALDKFEKRRQMKRKLTGKINLL